jgi:hypothetical protein
LALSGIDAKAIDAAVNYKAATPHFKAVNRKKQRGFLSEPSTAAYPFNSGSI